MYISLEVRVQFGTLELLRLGFRGARAERLALNRDVADTGN